MLVYFLEYHISCLGLLKSDSISLFSNPESSSQKNDSNRKIYFQSLFRIAFFRNIFHQPFPESP